MTFFDVVESRRTVRDFLPDPVPREVLDRCFDAARLAASSSNLQPWQFVVLRSPEKRAQAEAICLHQSAAKSAPLLVAVVAHTDTWRRHRDHIVATFEARGGMRKSQGTYYKKVIPLVYTTGPFGLLGLLKKAVSRIISLFRPMADLRSASGLRVTSQKSTALAAATFMLALRAEGFDSCPMEGFDPWRAKRLLGLGSGAEVCMFLAVGKRSETGVWWDRVLVPREWTVAEL